MAIPIQFEEVELSRDYTDSARWGPVFETGVVGNPLGVQQRNINRQDAIREGEINFGGLDNRQMEELEAFFMTKYGKAIGFRFFASRDHAFRDDLIGVGDGATLIFRLKRRYTGGTVVSERRIVKPVANTVLLRIETVGNDEYVGLSDGAGGWIWPVYGDVDYGDSVPIYIATIDWNTGIVTFNIAPPNGANVYAVSGEYDIPVCFATDRFQPTDYSTFADWDGVPLVELLPVTLGIV